MNKAIEEEIKGLKCDKCDYEDMSINVENYHDYVDAPCPDCGANLLTQADYDFVQVLMSLTDKINKACEERGIEDDGTLEEFSIKLDGSGIPKVGPLKTVQK